MPSTSPDQFDLEGALLTPAQRKRGLMLIAIASGSVGFVLSVQLGLNENFLVESFDITGYQKGKLESIRETCGLTALFVLALLSRFATPRIAAAMLALFAVGIAGYGMAPSYGWVIVMSLVWSQGFHVWVPLPGAMALSFAEPGRKGHRLGQIHAASVGGGALGLLIAYILYRCDVPMRYIFVMAACVGMMGAAACLAIPRQRRITGPRLIFRRRYGLYYILCFLEGWRKQIFICFAAFLLVKEHGTTLGTMLILRGIVQVIGYFIGPTVGRLVDRVGERKVLVFYFAGLTLFFLGYGTITNTYLLYGLFIIDNAFFVFVLALTTFVDKLVPPSEHTQTLSMGVAMDHAAAVIMPLLGGIVWAAFGYQWVFIAGAAVALLSVIPALYIPKHIPTAPAAEASSNDAAP